MTLAGVVSSRIAPEPMDALIRGLAIAGGFVLLLAASRKVGHPHALADTLGRVGVPTPWASVVAAWVPYLEVAAAMVIVVAVGHPIGAIPAMVVGVALIGVGSRGLGSASPIPCSCFSAHSSHPLGWRQLGMGAGFLIVGLLGPSTVEQTSAVGSVASLAGAAMGVAVFNVASLLRPLLLARDERLATGG